MWFITRARANPSVRGVSYPYKQVAPDAQPLPRCEPANVEAPSARRSGEKHGALEDQTY
jgi:hypothetical protein